MKKIAAVIVSADSTEPVGVALCGDPNDGQRRSARPYGSVETGKNLTAAKRMIFFCTFILFIIVVILIKPNSVPWFMPHAVVKKPPSKVIMGYCTPEGLLPLSSAEINGYEILKRKIEKLNVLAYAFLRISPDGKLLFTERDRASFDFFASLPSKSPSLKKLISFGGADDQASFYYATNNKDTFISSISDALNEYQLSGIDLDFELNRPYQPEEAKQYVTLIKKLRQKLGKKQLISMTTVVDPETLNSMGSDNWKILAKNTNFISMMCYDFASPLIKPYVTEFNSNLFLVHSVPSTSYHDTLNCDSSIKYLQKLGVPANKIVMGIPAYASAYGGVSATNDGLFQPSDPMKTPIFDDMGKGLLRYATVLTLNRADYQEHHLLLQDGHIGGFWLYSPQKHQFITYDNPISIHDKVSYLVKNNLAGIMIWQIGQDVPVSNNASLLKAISDDLKSN